MRSIRQNIRTAVLSYGPNEVRSVPETKVRIFPYGTNNWLISHKSFIVYSHQELVEKLLESCGGSFFEVQYRSGRTLNQSNRKLVSKYITTIDDHAEEADQGRSDFNVVFVVVVVVFAHLD